MTHALPITSQFASNSRANPSIFRGILAATVVVAAAIAVTAPADAQTYLRLQTAPDETLIEILDGSNVSVDPMTGDITVTPADPAACQGNGNCDAQVTIGSFSLNPSSISQGQSFTATFEQRGAWECERVGLSGTGWPAVYQDPTNNIITVSVPSTVDEGSYDLTLNCRNGTASPDAFATAVATLQVSQAGANIPQFCVDEGRLPPATWTQELNGLFRNLAATTETWEQMFGLPFPRGQAEEIRVREDRYLALAFELGTTGQSGSIGFSDPGGNITDISQFPALVTMSQCPGDFLPQDDPDCRQTNVGGQTPSFLWTRSTNDIVRCEISRNTPYFFNITFVSPATEDSTNPADFVWQCVLSTNEPCGWRISSTFVQ